MTNIDCTILGYIRSKKPSRKHMAFWKYIGDFKKDFPVYPEKSLFCFDTIQISDFKSSFVSHRVKQHLSNHCSFICVCKNIQDVIWQWLRNIKEIKRHFLLQYFKIQELLQQMFSRKGFGSCLWGCWAMWTAPIHSPEWGLWIWEAEWV